MFIFLISLTGIPPTAGFVGKFMLFKLAVGEGLARLAPHLGTSPACPPSLSQWPSSAFSTARFRSTITCESPKVMAFENDARPLVLNLVDRSYALAFAIPTVALLFFSPILQLIQMTAR